MARLVYPGGMTESPPTAVSHRSQGLTLNRFDWGNEDAAPVLLVHGMADHGRAWDAIAGGLRDAFHVIVPELRGHGDSDWSPDGAYMNPYHVQDLAELIDTLGYERVRLVGHSFGGNVTWRYAAYYPERVEKLVVIDGLGPSLAQQAKWAEAGPVARAREAIDKRRASAVRAPRRMASLEEAAARMAKANKRLSPEQARHLAEHGVRRHADGLGWKYDPLVSAFPPEDFALDQPTIWREIAAPTLICFGRESWTGDPAADGRAAYFRDARVIGFDEAGHWPHHDRADDVLRALRDFL